MPKTKLNIKRKLIVETKVKNINKEIVDAMFDLGLPVERMLKEADNLEPNIPSRQAPPVDSSSGMTAQEIAMLKLKGIKAGIVEY